MIYLPGKGNLKKQNKRKAKKGAKRFAIARSGKGRWHTYE